MFRRPLRLATVVSLALIQAVPASAHPKLLAATPAADSVVKSTSAVSLHFSEDLVAQFSGVEIRMTGMPGMAMAAPKAIGDVTTGVGPDGKTLVVKLKAPLAAGSYTLAWHAVSTDTHRTAGSYSFKVD